MLESYIFDKIGLYLSKTLKDLGEKWLFDNPNDGGYILMYLLLLVFKFSTYLFNFSSLSSP